MMILTWMKDFFKGAISVCNTKEYIEGDTLLNKIDNAKTPSNEENLELIKLAKNGDKSAEEELIIRNGKLVYKVYQKFNNKLKSDMIQEGLIALSQAIYSYDETKEVMFSTYAYTLIFNRMMDFISYNNGNIPYSKSMVKNLYKINKAKRELEMKNMAITDDNIIKETGLKPSSYYFALNNQLEVFSLDKKINDTDNENSLNDIIDNGENFEDDLVEKIANETLTTLLQKYLSERNYDIICRKYGLNGYQESTLEEIGKIYSMTAEGIRVVINSQFERLKRIKSIQALRSTTHH